MALHDNLPQLILKHACHVSCSSELTRKDWCSAPSYNVDDYQKSFRFERLTSQIDQCANHLPQELDICNVRYFSNIPNIAFSEHAKWNRYMPNVECLDLGILAWSECALFKKGTQDQKSTRGIISRGARIRRQRKCVCSSARKIVQCLLKAEHARAFHSELKFRHFQV